MIKFFTYLESLGNQLLSVYVSWFISLTIFIIPGEKFPLTVFFYSFLWVSLSNRWNMLCGGRNCELRTHNCEGRKILLGVKPVSDLKNSTEVSSNALENIKWFKWCGAVPWLWKFLHLLSEVLKATEKNESYVGKMNQMQVETTLVRLFWNFYGVVSNKNLSIYM